MTRTTLIYVATLCLLAVLAVAKFMVPQGPAPIAFKLPALKAEEVTKIVLTKGDQAVTMERGPDKAWQITAPFKFQADSSAVDGLLKNFEQEIPMDLKMTDDPKEHVTYEVTPEKAVKVELFKGETPEVAILVGKNATGGTSYIRPVNSQEVFRAKVGSRARFDKPALDWREKRIFDVKKEEISRLEIQSDKEHYIFSQAQGKWKAELPEGLPVDQMVVDGLARNISMFRAADIVEKAETDPGFDKPSMKIVMTLPSGAKTLLVGAMKPGKEKDKPSGELYVKRDGDTQLYTARDGSLKTFEKSLDELRDKSVFTFNPEDITEITVARAAKQVHLKLEKEGWKVIEPAGMQGDQKAIQGMMASIATLRISAFASGTEIKTAGLDKEPLEVSLVLKDGTKTGLKIGGEKGPGEAFAVRTDKPTELFTLSDASVNTFKRILGESVPKPAGPPAGMAGAGGMRLPPGMQLPPGVQLPPGMQ